MIGICYQYLPSIMINWILIENIFIIIAYIIKREMQHNRRIKGKRMIEEEGDQKDFESSESDH